MLPIRSIIPWEIVVKVRSATGPQIKFPLCALSLHFKLPATILRKDHERDLFIHHLIFYFLHHFGSLAIYLPNTTYSTMLCPSRILRSLVSITLNGKKSYVLLFVSLFIKCSRNNRIFMLDILTLPTLIVFLATWMQKKQTTSKQRLVSNF